MLDVSRHFMRSDMILRLLDEMARYKLNRFHWHLVDGGGWRFPSTKYPLLTKKAAYRMTNDWDAFWQKDRKFVDEGTPGAYGGYYTRAEIRQVVEQTIAHIKAWRIHPHRLPPPPAHIRTDHHRRTLNLRIQNYPPNNLQS